MKKNRTSAILLKVSHSSDKRFLVYHNWKPADKSRPSVWPLMLFAIERHGWLWFTRKTQITNVQNSCCSNEEVNNGFFNFFQVISWVVRIVPILRTRDIIKLNHPCNLLVSNHNLILEIKTQRFWTQITLN